MGGTTYGYNANGDMVSMTNASGTTTYAYDSLNRLVSVTSPTDSWVYDYDALGDLVATIHDGQTTTDLVDPNGAGDVVGQYTGGGSLIASYTYGLGLVSQTTSSGTNYYQFDGQGSTVGLTNVVSGLVSTYNYLPTGTLLASTGSAANPFTYLGADRRLDRRQRSFGHASAARTTRRPAIRDERSTGPVRQRNQVGRTPATTPSTVSDQAASGISTSMGPPAFRDSGEPPVFR